MDLLVVVPLALVGALLTLLLCDVAGSIARSRGRSYWLFFALGLLLWFPALLLALALPARQPPPEVPGPRRVEGVLARLVAALGALAALGGLAAAVAFAP